MASPRIRGHAGSRVIHLPLHFISLKNQVIKPYRFKGWDNKICYLMMQGITRIIETELKLCTVYPTGIICFYLHSPLVTRYSCQFHWKPTHIVKIHNYNHRIWLSSFWKTAFCFPTHEAKCIYIVCVYIYIYIYTHYIYIHTYIVSSSFIPHLVQYLHNVYQRISKENNPGIFLWNQVQQPWWQCSKLLL